jgi:hypothetical protein
MRAAVVTRMSHGCRLRALFDDLLGGGHRDFASQHVLVHLLLLPILIRIRKHLRPHESVTFHTRARKFPGVSLACKTHTR